MNWINFKDYFLPGLTFLSIMYNIYNIIVRRNELKSLKSNMQTQYNLHSNAARVCDRIRQIEKEEISDKSKVQRVIAESNIIRGIADSARTIILSYSREHLKFVPYYEHPAIPGEIVAFDINFGMTPKEYKEKCKKDQEKDPNE